MGRVSARNLGLLVLGVAAVSVSSILIRLAEDAPPLVIAFYRNAFAAALLLPFALTRRRAELRALTRRQWGACAASGAFLAAHFALWIPSLSFTTVAASTVLVTTQPIWVGAAGHWWLGERLTRAAVAGIAVALAGAVVVSGSDFGLSDRGLLGDLLALGGAWAAAGYFLIGRRVRQGLSLVTYAAIVYSTCAALLAVVVAVSGQPFLGHAPNVWLLFLLMALVPQILGHTVFNFLLGDVEAAVIAIAVMGEPVGATVLALVILGESPPLATVLGGALILAGVYLAIAAQARRRAAPIPVPVE